MSAPHTYDNMALEIESTYERREVFRDNFER